MFMKFETKVLEIIERSSDVKSFRFPRPSELTFKSGQYLMATIKIGDKQSTKPFSISSSPTIKEYVEFTKKLTDSEYSTALRGLQGGDWTEIVAPLGTFIFEGQYDRIILLAGGIGITPFMSMIKYCTDTHQPANITLLFACKTEKDIVFKNELEEMQSLNPNLKIVFILSEPESNWKGVKGRINAELIKKEVPDYKERIFYAAGPPGMVNAMQKLVGEMDIAQSQIKTETLIGHM